MADDSPLPDHKPLFTLTLEGVAEKSRELASAAKKVHELTSWFAGLRLVMGDDLWRSAVSPEAQRVVEGAQVGAVASPLKGAAVVGQAPVANATGGRASRLSWVRKQLSDSDGLSILDLTELAKDSPHESAYRGDPNEFAEWLVSTARGGRLKRRGDRIYKNDPALPGPGAKPIPRANDVIRDAILSTLRQEGGRAEPSVIVKGIRENPETSEVITPQSQYPYTILMRMVADGTLQKDGSQYVLPEIGDASSD